MNSPEHERRWHQFSLRSLLLFVTLVSMLCSIGASTHWNFAAALAISLAIGGICGGMAGGTRAGIVAGAAFGIPGFFLAVVILAALLFPASGLFSADAWSWLCRFATAIGGILGGVAGGRAARAR